MPGGILEPSRRVGEQAAGLMRVGGGGDVVVAAENVAVRGCVRRCHSMSLPILTAIWRRLSTSSMSAPACA